VEESSVSERALAALRAWRQFAATTQVLWNGETRSWAAHIAGLGYVDEERLIQPLVFPAFARDLLGYGGNDLAAEEPGGDGKPDFTPADLLTHPFVFETKSTREQTLLPHDHLSQVTRYLLGAADRIDRVVLTNLVGVRVYERDQAGGVRQAYSVDLRGLLAGQDLVAATTGEAERLADLISDFSHRELTLAEKLERVRRAPEWNPLIEATSPDWLLRRLENVVALLTADVRRVVLGGILTDSATTTGDERASALEEVRGLAARLGGEETKAAWSDFVSAEPDTMLGKALRQYESHVAYYAATRLLLVRIWEDLGLLTEILRDGGFDEWMAKYEDIVADVVQHSFNRASRRYRSLFVRHRSYGWYTPSDEAYGEAIYQLANTYLGAVQSDILGQVYERLLERIDRNLLGQYYTPRDVIALIWDLIDLDGEAGARISVQHWLSQIADGLTGVEIQRFSSYLAELNLLVQLGQVAATESVLRLPPLGIIPGDTLSLHDPVDGDPGEIDCASEGLQGEDQDALTRARRVSGETADGTSSTSPVGIRLTSVRRLRLLRSSVRDKCILIRSGSLATTWITCIGF
jgi:hypothetical protein